MDKNTLNKAVEICKEETREILQTICDELNNGQRNKLLRNAKIKEKFDKFNVDYDKG